MRMAVYAAQVDRMDQGVGRIVDALRRGGVLDDTVVMICSDNGGCSELLHEDADGDDLSRYSGTTSDGRVIQVGNRPDLTPGGADKFMSYDLPWANASNSPFRRYKSWVHEGGISTPFVVHWPNGIADPGVRTSPLHFIDVLPTLAELAGATIPPTATASTCRLRGVRASSTPSSPTAGGENDPCGSSTKATEPCVTGRGSWSVASPTRGSCTRSTTTAPSSTTSPTPSLPACVA